MAVTHDTTQGLQGLRILVVEDSFLTARSLIRLLEDLGVNVLGPAPSVKRAMSLLDANSCDGALLDINLGIETVEPVAERLDNAGIPFLFVSGYSSPKLVNPRYKDRPLVAKPVDPVVLARIFSAVMGVA